PNKDEIWLHWSLLDTARARFAMLRRRLLPEQLPSAASDVHVSPEQLTVPMRLAGYVQSARFIASRITHHTLALPSVVWSGIRWFTGTGTLGREFWKFFFAEAFFDFGMFVFVFLYNLYLLKLGFKEDFVGLVAGAMTAGNIVGSLLAVVAMQ